MDKVQIEDRALAITEARAGQSVLAGVVVDDDALLAAWELARRDWLAAKAELSGGQNTVDTYMLAFRQFFEWCRVRPWEVSSGWAQKWRLRLKEQGLADSTISLKLAALSSFYDYVIQFCNFPTPDGREVSLWHVDRRNPFAAVKRPKVRAYGRATFPTLAEAEAILDAVNTDSPLGKRDFALLYTFLVTCRRCREVLNMKWGDLRELEDGDYAFAYIGKGGQEEEAVLNRRCYQAICLYLEADGRPPEEMTDEDYVWIPLDPTRVQRLPAHQGQPVEANRPISNSMVNRIIKKYARRAGVDEEKAHAHALRHVGALRRVDNQRRTRGGVDLLEIKDLLKHASVATTQIYVEEALTEPEDPGGDEAALAWLPKGRPRRRKKEPAAEQGRLL